jgi:hypothetical protein
MRAATRRVLVAVFLCSWLVMLICFGVLLYVSFKYGKPQKNRHGHEYYFQYGPFDERVRPATKAEWYAVRRFNHQVGGVAASAMLVWCVSGAVLVFKVWRPAAWGFRDSGDSANGDGDGAEWNRRRGPQP